MKLNKEDLRLIFTEMDPKRVAAACALAVNEYTYEPSNDPMKLAERMKITVGEYLIAKRALFAVYGNPYSGNYNLM